MDPKEPVWQVYKGFNPWVCTPTLTERGKTVWEFVIPPPVKDSPNGGGFTVGDSGGVNGRVLSGMANMACSHCATMMLAAGETLIGCVELNGSYLRPAGGKKVSAVAEVIRKGRLFAFVDCEVKDDQDRVCTKFRTVHALGGAAKKEGGFEHEDL